MCVPKTQGRHMRKRIPPLLWDVVRDREVSKNA